MFGELQTTIRQTISPEGSILVDNLGPIYLSGMTVREANNTVRREFSKSMPAFQVRTLTPLLI